MSQWICRKFNNYSSLLIKVQGTLQDPMASILQLYSKDFVAWQYFCPQMWRAKEDVTQNSMIVREINKGNIQWCMISLQILWKRVISSGTNCVRDSYCLNSWFNWIKLYSLIHEPRKRQIPKLSCGNCVTIQLTVRTWSHELGWPGLLGWLAPPR